MEFAYLLKRFYTLSESQIYEFIRFFTMSIAEYVEEYFESDVILAHFSGGSIIGTGLGVYSPGTAYVLLHHAMGDIRSEEHTSNSSHKPISYAVFWLKKKNHNTTVITTFHIPSSP